MINLKEVPHSSGVYYFKSNNEVIYVGSSKNLYNRMAVHNTAIKQGSHQGCQTNLYQFLQSNQFTVQFQLETNYKQLEQQLIEQYNPKYNCLRAFTGISWNGNGAEYEKEYREKYKEEKKQYDNQYYEAHKEEKKQYKNQKCLYNGEILTLSALQQRFSRKGVANPTQEAKKHLI